MTLYYNLTQVGGGTGIIGFWRTISMLTKYTFGYMLVAITFIIPLIYMIKNDEDTTKSLNVSSFYTILMSLFLYLAGIILKPQIIYVAGLVYIITASVRWYHRD